MPIRCRIYDDYSTIMSDNGLVYDLTFKWGLRTSALFNRDNNTHDKN